MTIINNYNTKNLLKKLGLSQKNGRNLTEMSSRLEYLPPFLVWSGVGSSFFTSFDPAADGVMECSASTALIASANNFSSS